MPPVCGNAPAISASVNAPHMANAPPTIHTESNGNGPGNRFVILAGDRKIPEPMVVPMTTAMALQRPSRRGSAEGGSTVVGSRMTQYARAPAPIAEG